MRFLLSILFTLFLLTFLVGCQQQVKKEYHEDVGKIFNTKYTIKYEFNKSLRQEIELKLQEFDNSLNPFKKNSIISKVNNNETVELDTFFVNVITKSIEVSRKSDGLFDITLSPLINAWGFGFKNYNSMTDSMIDSLKLFVGYEKMKLENNQLLKLDSRLNINASAIAKGYAVDVIAQLLDSYEIDNYMVEIGGEVRTKGVSRIHRPWRIAITKPMKANDFNYNSDQLQIVLGLSDKSLATSGDFYKYYVKDGKKYAHTIDPRTARPAENGIMSATVIADDCMSADAFATVFMLADTAVTRKIARDEGLEYMLILSSDKNGLVVVESDKFNNYVLE